MLHNVPLYKLCKFHINSKIVSVEHSIELTVERVNRCKEDINGGDSCGESDCYIQYQFPQQTHQLQGLLLLQFYTCKTFFCPMFVGSTNHYMSKGNFDVMQEF